MQWNKMLQKSKREEKESRREEKYKEINEKIEQISVVTFPLWHYFGVRILAGCTVIDWSEN